MAAKLGNLRVFYVKKARAYSILIPEPLSVFSLELSRIKLSREINYPHTPPLA